MTTEAIPEEQQFVLDGVDWAFYESVLEGLGNRHIFVTYDQGRLEFMSPSFRHDKRGRFIGLLINVVSEELGIRMQGGGSTTFRRKDLEKGLEPDECFYVKHVDEVIHKDEIDLSIDPPPDLAIEVEISRRLIKRIPIYESLGVSELWRDDGDHVTFHVLGSDRRFHQAEKSLNFPMLSRNEIDRLLLMAEEMDEMSWMRSARKWVRENLTK